MQIGWRFATESDMRMLAELNHQLIADEGHRNAMNVERLEHRMRGWLAAEYRAVLFETEGQVVAYALFRQDESRRTHLRQFFVVRDLRRRGVGASAFRLFRSEVAAKDAPIVVETLIANSAALAFWRKLGFADYAVTLELEPSDASARVSS